MHDECAQFSVKCYSRDQENDTSPRWSAGQLRASSRGKTEGASVIRFDWV